MFDRMVTTPRHQRWTPCNPSPSSVKYPVVLLSITRADDVLTISVKRAWWRGEHLGIDEVSGPVSRNALQGTAFGWEALHVADKVPVVR